MTKRDFFTKRNFDVATSRTGGQVVRPLKQTLVDEPVRLQAPTVLEGDRASFKHKFVNRPAEHDKKQSAMGTARKVRSMARGNHLGQIYMNHGSYDMRNS